MAVRSAGSLGRGRTLVTGSLHEVYGGGRGVGTGTLIRLGTARTPDNCEALPVHGETLLVDRS
ncbi:hypothetical protein GCM10009608_07200 [Pseudonocardia alaniniphila]